MDDIKSLTPIQIGLTAHIHDVRGSTTVSIEGVGEGGTNVRLRLRGWKPLQALLEVCEEALTDIRAECPHITYDDLIGLGYCDKCGMGDEEVEAQHKEEVVSGG